ncbi:MAG: hypothetical protein L0Y71_12980 [Gemmataceae bacterium]|nr:hypothetical protein [Gemmataceae bacterium]
MNQKVSWKWLIVAFAAGALVALRWAPGTVPVRAQAAQEKAVQPGPTWLQGEPAAKWGQVEKHFRGLDVAMAEIGYRYGELLRAAKTNNWEYAKYHTEKIEFALRLAVERRPKRAKSADTFLKEAIPTVLTAIESKNASDMKTALAKLHYQC